MIVKVFFNTDLLSPDVRVLFEHELKSCTKLTAFLFVLRQRLEISGGSLHGLGFAGGTVATDEEMKPTNLTVNLKANGILKSRPFKHGKTI